MANVKVSALPADATPSADDLIMTVNDPGGTPVNKKVTLANLFAVMGGGSGDVVGPASATDNALVRFDATTGKLLQNSVVIVSDAGSITVPEVTAPSTPAAGTVHVYAKSDGKLYIKDDAGTETDLTATGGGGGISGLTTGKLPKAASATTLTDSTVFVDGSGVNIGANDLLVSQSIRSGGTNIYISGNVSNAGGITGKNNQNFGWASGSDATAAQDIGLSRFGAGALEVNKGNPTSAGSQTDLRDLMVRRITATTGLNSAADAGSTDDYAITLSPAIAAYVIGQTFSFKANTANTGAATLNVNGVGAKTIVKLANGITTALDSNDIRAGQYVIVIYDGTNMQMVSQLGNAASASVWARVYHNAAQSLTSGASLFLSFNSERNDTDTIHDTATNNSRLTCRTAGVYLIAATMNFAANAVGNRTAAFRVNGTIYISVQSTPGVAGAAAQISFSTIYALAVNDYVEVGVSQNSGGALDVESGASYSPEFMMIRLGG